MAMPPRASRRRGGSQRWLIIPFVLTILILLVDASMHARSAQPQKTLDNEAWLDRALPEITASSAQGVEIASLASPALRPGQPDPPAATAAQELLGIAAAANATFKAVSSSAPPTSVSASAGLLDACLAARRDGSAEMAAAVQHLVAGGGTNMPSALAQMAAAVSDFEVGDRAYELFVTSLPRLGVRMPSSRWVTGSAAYQPAGLAAFAARLVHPGSKPPAAGIVIDAVTTNPQALSVQGSVEVLSPALSLAVTVVVANPGTVAVDDGAVAASITPAEPSASQRVEAPVSLSPGHATAVTLYGLKMRPSVPTVLTVTATVGSSPGPSKTLRVELPGPDFAGVPTTATTRLRPTTSAPNAAPTTSAPTTSVATTSVATTSVATTSVATTTST